ncbi:MAG: hypothetical protein AAFQ51_07725 [Pseudomonadota bacterium]
MSPSAADTSETASPAVTLEETRRLARQGTFDDRAVVACAQERGQALGSCNAAVARGQGGTATVVVTFPTGFARHLYFAEGAFLRANATMSGVGTDTDWSGDGVQIFIRVDDQRFELPVAFVFGPG